jgi:hypothetical protein
MKWKWVILVIVTLTLCLVACDSIFDDDNYVWDDWAVALF